MMADDGTMKWGLSSRVLWWLIAPLLAIAFVVQDASPSLFLYDIFVPRLSRLQSFSNQTVWVTGASSGIGLEILCLLMEANTKQVIISSRRQGDLEKSIETCNSRLTSPSSTNVSMVPYDASVHDPMEIVDRVLSMVAPHLIDRLFLNAGIYQFQPALETPLEYSRRIMKVNYQSPTEIATSLLQRSDKRLHIVVVASIISKGAHALASSYSASKHALRAYFHTLATEMPNGGRVDVACPAGTKTQLWESMSSSSPVPKVMIDLMEPQRVAWLILTGATGPYWMFWETWIGKPVPLLWTMAASYMPGVSQCMAMLFGWCRMYFYREQNADVSDLWTLLGALFVK